MHRAAIFLHWDKDNIIDDYVVKYLSELHTVVQDIHFVSNSAVSQKELEKVVFCTKRASCRKNEGLDFGAWKEVLESNGFDEVAGAYDEVVLANDSCYGPLFPFSKMFNAMAQRQCDFWGVTKNLNPTHIQSYFYVFRKPVLESQAFRDFFTNFNYGYNREETISNCEIALTDILCQVDLHYEVYTDYCANDIAIMHKRIGASDVCDMTVYYWPELVERRAPLLKIKALPKYVELFSRSMGFYLKQLQKILVDQGSEYDCQLIYRHQKRIHPESYVLIKCIENLALCYFKIIRWKFLNRQR